MTLQERIDQLGVEYGSQRRAADALGICHVYLSRLKTGSRHAPSDDVLQRLGLRRVVSYELLKTPNV